MEYKTLNDIAKITMGQSPDSSSYNKEKDGLPFFQGNADFGELYPNERIWCNEPKKVAMPGDILISVRAPIGALNYAKDKSCIGRGLAAITIKNIVERNYIFHLLKAKNNYLNSKGTGSTFKAIGKNVLEEVLVPQISREEQQKCVNIIDVLESIIRERQSQIAKLDELIKARFVELFGNPVINDKGWKICRLGDKCKVINGRAYKTEELLDRGKYQVLRVGNFFTNNTWYYSDLELDKDKYCEEGDLLFAWSASFGPRIWHGKKVIYHYHIWKLVGYERYLNKNFFVELLNYNCEAMKADTHGSTMLHFTKAQMEEQQLILPPIEIQDQFAHFINEVNKSKVEVKKALDEAQLLFDSLMQKYFG